MVEANTEHTLHAEYVISMFGTRTYALKCNHGESEAVVSINWGEGFLLITAAGDPNTIDIRRSGAVSSWKN